MLVIHLVRQGPEQGYQSCFPNVTNQGQNTPATQATLIFNFQNIRQLRLLKIWKTNVDVFTETELNYATTLCPYREVVLSVDLDFVYAVVHFYFS